MIVPNKTSLLLLLLLILLLLLLLVLLLLLISCLALCKEALEKSFHLYIILFPLGYHHWYCWHTFLSMENR